jgi:hypothetical protein
VDLALLLSVRAKLARDGAYPVERLAGPVSATDSGRRGHRIGR